MLTVATSPTSDADLLAAVRRREVDALHALYVRHGGRALAVAGVVARHRRGVDPEQLTVEAFVELWDLPPSDADVDVASDLARRIGRLAAERFSAADAGDRVSTGDAPPFACG